MSDFKQPDYVNELDKNEVIQQLNGLREDIKNHNFGVLPREWGGGYVVISADPIRIAENIKYYDDTCVYTKHARKLSWLMIKLIDIFEIKNRRDFFFYGYIALIANDYLKNKGNKDAAALLNHVIDKMIPWLETFPTGFSGGVENKDKLEELIRENTTKITTEEIRRVQGFV